MAALAGQPMPVVGRVDTATATRAQLDAMVQDYFQAAVLSGAAADQLEDDNQRLRLDVTSCRGRLGKCERAIESRPVHTVEEPVSPFVWILVGVAVAGAAVGGMAVGYQLGTP